MAKQVHDSVLDAALNKVATATVMTLCTLEPTTYTQATATYKLATTTMQPANFTNAGGTTSGRQANVAARTGVSVDTTGTATHVALCDATTVLYVTTMTSQSLTAGNTVDIGGWAIQIADPT